MGDFCFVLKIDRGCLLIGTITFVLSFASTLASASFLILHHQGVFEAEVLLDLGRSSTIIFLTAFFIVNIVWLIASLMLLVGINTRKPGYVLFYFAFGILVTIFLQLGGLLELLDKRWTLATIQFLGSLFYIHCLMVVYKYYEAIQHFAHQPLDEQPILDTENLDL